MGSSILYEMQSINAIKKNKIIYKHPGSYTVLTTQLCPTFWDLMDCNLPGSSIYVILQARILEWAAISFSRGCSQPRDQTRVSHIAGRFFTDWAAREAQGLI